MQNRFLIAAALCASALPALAQTALDDVMARKSINIAIPTDLPARSAALFTASVFGANTAWKNGE